MNNPKPRAVAEINLEEFERRLRASVAPQAGVEDPLAELTRLVDTVGFERKPAERALEAQRIAKLEAQPAPAPVAAVPVAVPPPVAEAPQIEASPTPESDLRPSFDIDIEDLYDATVIPAAAGAEEYGEAPPEAPWDEAAGSEAAARPERARGWTMKVGGLIAAAAVMAGAVFVFKVGGHGHSGAPPLILASTAPTKVPPPSDTTIRTANESGALLTRDTAQPTPTPPKLVNTPEAPVDLSARPGAKPSPAASAASPTPTAVASTDASPVAPSSNTPIVASVAQAAAPVSPIGDDPNRVKTISVRPDGTLISSGYEANAAPAPSAPAAPAASATPVAQADTDTQASTPAVALPTKLSPPKSSERIVARTETTAPADAGDGPAPVAPKPKIKKPKPVKEAEAKSEDLKTDDVKTDDAEAPAVASGGYAVQLAAPKSESEAKALAKRLQGRYADAIGSVALGIRKAERHGEAIYRVRAGGLSKEDAKAMCAKIKSAGGDCYVAKN